MLNTLKGWNKNKAINFVFTMLAGFKTLFSLCLCKVSERHKRINTKQHQLLNKVQTKMMKAVWAVKREKKTRTIPVRLPLFVAPSPWTDQFSLATQTLLLTYDRANCTTGAEYCAFLFVCLFALIRHSIMAWNGNRPGSSLLCKLTYTHTHNPTDWMGF